MKDNPFYSQGRFVCAVCLFSSSSRDSAKHLQEHDLTMQEYCKRYVHPEQSGLCTYCKKPTKFRNISHGWDKHCSRFCYNKMRKEGKTTTNV